MFVRVIAPLLRLFFHLLYHPFAWAYDLVAAAVSLGRWKSWTLAVLPYLIPPPRISQTQPANSGAAVSQPILELGFGPGHLQCALKQAGYAVTGLDESWPMARQARRRLARLGLAATLIRSDARRLPFERASFKQVVATFPSEYIFQPQTLGEIWRVLQPGGQAVILLMAWITGRSFVERFLARLFSITGQTNHQLEPVLEPARAAGFEVLLERAQCRSSEVLVVILTKGVNSEIFPPLRGDGWGGGGQLMNIQ